MQKQLGKKETSSFVWIVSVVGLSVLLILSAPSAEAQGDKEQYSSAIQQIFDFIQRRYVEEVDPQVLYEGAMKGMFEALGDPYSAFLPAAEMTDITDTTQGRFGGVGLYISKQVVKDKTPSFVEVAAPIEDTPGWRAGILPGDLIVKIEDESTADLTMNEVLDRLRGRPGTKVNLIIRRGKLLEFPTSLERAIIEVPTAKYAMIGDIGYLKLITFTPMTAQRTRETILEFKSKNYKAIILDLRNNYGGLLNSAVDICDMFLDGGVVVSTKSRLPGENVVYNAKKGALVSPDIPVIVLINQGSASASEIVSGALKDRGRAYLVGEKSYGKGSVQQVFPLSDRDGFRITVARYYTPSDVNIDRIGIPPDREVKFPEFTEEDVKELQKLLESNEIRNYIEAHTDLNDNDSEIAAFTESLNKKYGLDVTLLKRLVRDEQNRTKIAPVFDLEYDVQLQESVKILRDGSYSQAMQNTKTLKQLQEQVLD
ncbi:MAG: S41 family peptidase [Treponema sp.]|jgi:carboxyl-terminal processing protease|nr:S41 family peptidase [Treponema sp.]